MGKAGLTYPMMTDIEQKLGVSPWLLSGRAPFGPARRVSRERPQPRPGAIP